jgi:hypothetical protein
MMDDVNGAVLSQIMYVCMYSCFRRQNILLKSFQIDFR